MIDRPMRVRLRKAVKTMLAARSRGLLPGSLPGEPDSPLEAVDPIADELTVSADPLTERDITIRLPSQKLFLRMQRSRLTPYPRTEPLSFIECALMIVFSECGWRLDFALVEMKNDVRVVVWDGAIITCGPPRSLPKRSRDRTS